MRRFHATNRLLLAAALCSSISGTPAVAQSAADDARFQAAQQRFDAELARFRAEFDRYQGSQRARGAYDGDQRYGDVRDDPYRAAPPNAEDRNENGYDPARYYRSGSQYQERTLASDDRVYRGEDGRYYCKRNDGTTGLILGAAGGGILGNVIDGGHSRIVGTLLGGAAGAFAGRAVDQNRTQVRCR